MFNLILGGFFIVLGFLVKKYPNLIAGYNTMPEHEKKNVDIGGLSSMMRICFVLIGVLIAGGIPFFKMIDWEVNPVFYRMIVILSITVVMVVQAQTYDHNSPSWLKKLFPIAIIVGISLFVGLKMSENHEPLNVSIAENQITISGSYGLTSEMKRIELLEVIPKIKSKTNGYDDGAVRKGKFLLEEWGTCKLFLQSTGGPYIRVYTSGVPILINGGSSSETKRLFDELEKNIK